MVPIILSVGALYFAYKSNIINREWADVHLRITTQAFMGWQTPENYFIEDDIFYFRATIGSLENIDEQMNNLTIATSDLSMRWLSEAVGWDPDTVNSDNLPYMEYFIFLALCNDGDQIAENLNIDFNWYRVDNFDDLRGEEAIPEDIEPELWTYGPSILPPDQWIIIPLGQCFIRLDPTSQDPSFRYIGDFYEPIEIRYTSAVSDNHTQLLDFEQIPQCMNAFAEPPMPVEEEPAGEQDGTRASGNDTPARSDSNK